MLCNRKFASWLCRQQMCDAVMSVWTKISQECLQHLVDSMSQRDRCSSEGERVQNWQGIPNKVGCECILLYFSWVSSYFQTYFKFVFSLSLLYRFYYNKLEINFFFLFFLLLTGNIKPQADLTASGSGVICADKISGVHVDECINFSVSVKAPQENTGNILTLNV